MLFLATFLVFLLAMGGLALGLAVGRGAPAAGCGRDCRCVEERPGERP